jgi:hypothetical protein
LAGVTPLLRLPSMMGQQGRTGCLSCRAGGPVPSRLGGGRGCAVDAAVPAGARPCELSPTVRSGRCIIGARALLGIVPGPPEATVPEPTSTPRKSLPAGRGWIMRSRSVPLGHPRPPPRARGGGRLCRRARACPMLNGSARGTGRVLPPAAGGRHAPPVMW